MAEPMDVVDSLRNEDLLMEAMDTSSSSAEIPQMLSDSQVVTAQPGGFRPPPSVQTPHGPNQDQDLYTAGDQSNPPEALDTVLDIYTDPQSLSAAPDFNQALKKSDENAQWPAAAADVAAADVAAADEPESSAPTSRKPAAGQKKHQASTDKTDTQPSAPPDVAVVHVKVDWPEMLPERWRYHLEKALQTWCNSRTEDKGSVSIVQLLDDERTAEVAITPSSVLKDLKSVTLMFKKLDKSANVHFQRAELKPANKSSRLTDVGAPSTLPGDAETTEASAPLTVPPFLYCYLSQVHKQEVEKIEKTFGVKIKAETCVSISAENTNQKDGSESVRRATEEFTQLYQKNTKNLKAVSISLADMESDIMKETMRNISHQENKIMLNMSANEYLLFGPQNITLMVTNHLPSNGGAGVTSSSSYNKSHGDSMETSRSHAESMQATRSLNLVLTDTPTLIEMDEAHWNLLLSAFEERLLEIQKRFGVEFQAEPVQGLVKVSARSRRAHQVNLEAHALSALTHLYQKVVTSALTCDLTDAACTKSVQRFKEVLPQHACVQGGQRNGNWQLFGLPKHLAPAVADMEKVLGRPVVDEKMKKVLKNLWNVPQASGFQRGPMETDAARGPEPPELKPKFSNKANDKENESDDVCSICLDTFNQKKKLNCGHEFCKGCLKRSIQSSGEICPLCKAIFGVLKGNQPDGTMQFYLTHQSLPGYPDCGVIEINYNIPSGIQTSAHPNPGQGYCGTRRIAYLPDNSEGNHVLKLLRRAFDQKLIFTVGISRTTGCDNVVIWNDVHHKTNKYGGPEGFGYPDPNYLKRVREELKAKGIE